LIFCSSFIEEQILYNGEDSENFSTIVLYSRYRPISNIIFKQQIRKVYVKVSIEKKLQIIAYFDFLI